MTSGIGAVDEVTSRLSAAVASTDCLRLFIEFDPHPGIEGVERSFPQPFATEFLAVPDDAAFDLIDLSETTFFHESGEHLTSNPSGAIGDDRLLFEVVIFATLEFGNEIPSRRGIGNHSILKSSDLGFECVATIEEDHILTFCHEAVYFLGSEMISATDNTRAIDLNVSRTAKSNQLGPDLDRKPWKVGAGSIRPLEVDSFEALELSSLTDILLQSRHLPAESSVDPVFRDQDPSGQAKGFTEIALPKSNRLGVCNWGEAVIKDDLI
jgi:hypothetical protein